MRWLRWTVLLLVAFAGVVVVAIGAIVVSAPVPDERPETTGREIPGETTHEGRPRTWISYVPETLAAPAPVVFALPGSGQTAQHLREATNFRFETLADRDGFLVVYAEAWIDGGTTGPEWNECRKNTALPAHLENVDDVGFIVGLLDRLAREYPVDADRIYAMGVSDGGQMSYRLATEHPDRFSAIAAVIAQQAAPHNSNCTDPKGPVSVLVMNGTADPIIPYGGGEASFFGWLSAGQVQSIDGTIAHWKQVNGIEGDGVSDALPDRDPEDDSTVVRTRWSSASDHEVVLYSIVGGGHTIPGGYGLPELLLGPTNRDIVAVDEIWSFFQRH